MRLYTSKVIADWLGLTERRVRQLRDEGIIEEQAPGLYDLRATTRRYISYLRSGSLADERAGLTRAKREAAEMENALMARRAAPDGGDRERHQDDAFEYSRAFPLPACEAVPGSGGHGRRPGQHLR